jgi:hypothetical protein
MKLNLKEIEVRHERLSRCLDFVDISGDGEFLIDEAVPAMLDWIRRAKDLLEIVTNHECHRTERGMCGLCHDCLGINLLSELED